MLSTSFATGADLKVVQDLLGHSSITITADTYAPVLPDLAKQTAEAAAAVVPRRTASAAEPLLTPISSAPGERRVESGS